MISNGLQCWRPSTLQTIGLSAAACLQAEVREREFGLRPRLNTDAVYDAQRR